MPKHKSRYPHRIYSDLDPRVYSILEKTAEPYGWSIDQFVSELLERIVETRVDLFKLVRGLSGELDTGETPVVDSSDDD